MTESGSPARPISRWTFAFVVAALVCGVGVTAAWLAAPPGLPATLWCDGPNAYATADAGEALECWVSLSGEVALGPPRPIPPDGRPPAYLLSVSTDPPTTSPLRRLLRRLRLLSAPVNRTYEVDRDIRPVEAPSRGPRRWRYHMLSRG